MAFIFRFQQILEICFHEENEVKTRLAKKDGQIAETAAKIKQLKQDYATGLEQQSADLLAGDIIKVQMYPAYLKTLQQSWEFQEEELERLEKQRQKILEELLEKQAEMLHMNENRSKKQPKNVPEKNKFENIPTK